MNPKKRSAWIRQHPNYTNNKAFTVEEAERYAVLEATVAGFRLVKLVHQLQAKLKKTKDKETQE